MNDAMPQWRTLSSDAPTEAAGEAEPTAPQEPDRAWPRWIVPSLAGLGGLASGMALVTLVASVAMNPGLLPADDTFASIGEPLDEMSTPGQMVAAPAILAAAVVVDVAGAVVRPGLHQLGAGARVGDAIEAAGGFAPRADLAATSQSLNLAQPLEDGAKVLVPELGIDRAPSAASADDGLLDLNRADQAELERLPGIGPVTARKILAARDERRFGDVRELRTRGLVGESVFEDLKSLVRTS